MKNQLASCRKVFAFKLFYVFDYSAITRFEYFLMDYAQKWHRKDIGRISKWLDQCANGIYEVENGIKIYNLGNYAGILFALSDSMFCYDTT